MPKIEPTPYSKDYEITDAMFGAFRTGGGAKFFWILVAWLTLAYAILFWLFMPPFFSAYGEMIMLASDTADAEVLSSFFSATWKLLAITGLMLPAAFIIQGVFRAAFFRGYFFHEYGGVFPLRFGGDEVRQSLAILGYYGLIVLLYTVGVFVMAIVAAGLVGLGGEGLAAFAVLLVILGYIALFVGFIWLLTKFGPSGALTALRGNTHVLAARHVTKNRFWALFGSVLVAGLIGYVVYYIAMGIGFATGLAGLFTPEIFTSFVSEDPADAIELIVERTQQPGFKAGFFLATLLTSFGAAFYMMMIAGPQAFFTRQWAAAGESVLAEVEAETS